MVCLPGVVDPTGQSKVITHCETMGDRFAILDGAQDPRSAQGRRGPADPARRPAVQERVRRAVLALDSDSRPHRPPDTPALVTVPPSGHIAGMHGPQRRQRGVHKAPANEPVSRCAGLDYTLNDTEHGVLNRRNINALRCSPARPPLVWGARTLTDGTPWRYVNVRRLVSYIEDSIVAGDRWAVFEPNNTALWKGLERTITEFLTRVWQSGALFGAHRQGGLLRQDRRGAQPAAVRGHSARCSSRSVSPQCGPPSTWCCASGCGTAAPRSARG